LVNLKSVFCPEIIEEPNINEFVNKVNVTKLSGYGIESVLSYLYRLGYLTNLEKKKYYKIPNLEVRKTFIKILTNYYEVTYYFDYQKGLLITYLINSIVSQSSKDKINEELRKFKTAFEDFLQTINVKILQNEDLFHYISVYLSLLATDIGLNTQIYTKKDKKSLNKKRKY